MSVFPRLAAFLDAERPEPRGARRDRLEEIAGFVRASEDPRLVFICTHNSRRSHLAQIWTQAAAARERVALSAYSGGTEATAFHPNAVAALRAAGFEIDEPGPGPNPVYRVRFAPAGPALEAFSKVYDAPPNPTAGFCAVMTCSEADAGCPTVRGAEVRVALPYEDPRESDGSGREAEVYAARSRQIASEMVWMVRRARG